MDFLVNVSYKTPHVTKKHVRVLYRRILSEARKFFDDNTREYIKNSARESFEKWSNEKNEKKIYRKYTVGKRKYRKIVKANQGDIKSIKKVLEYGYGRVGKLKWKIILKETELKHGEKLPFDTNAFKKSHPVLYQLALKQLGLGGIQVKVPTHREYTRKNVEKLQQRHYEKMISKLYPPLPIPVINELEFRSQTGVIFDGYIKTHKRNSGIRVTNNLNVLGFAHQGQSDQGTSIVKKRYNLFKDIIQTELQKEGNKASIEWQKTWVKMPKLRTVRRLYKDLLEKVYYIQYSHLGTNDSSTDRHIRVYKGSMTDPKENKQSGIMNNISNIDESNEYL